MLAVLIVLALVLTGCETTKDPVEIIVIPELQAFRPPYAPELIPVVQTDADLLHNSVQFEFLMYDWQDYAEALERYIQDIRDILKRPP